MKKIIFAIFLLALAVSCSKKSMSEPKPDPVIAVFPDTLGAAWTTKNVTPGNVIADIFFTDNNNGYLVSKTGIYKSIDGGNNWVQKNLSTGFYNIAASGNNALFIQNGLQPVLTTDGGNTFQSVTVSLAGDLPTDGFYSSLSNCHTANYRTNNKSVDGGQTFPFFYFFSDTQNYSTLFFLNDTNGWTLRRDTLYKTINGGANWTVLSSVTGNASAVEFINLNTGYYSNQLGVYKTIDSGINWQQVFFNSGTAFTDIDFVSAAEGYVSSRNQIFKTTNSGSTWTKVVALGNTNIIELHFTDASHGWACCENGTILKFN
jgi:photosystem II stability/assembly factor-like uncharacterized protein